MDAPRRCRGHCRWGSARLAACGDRLDRDDSCEVVTVSPRTFTATVVALGAVKPQIGAEVRFGSRSPGPVGGPAAHSGRWLSLGLPRLTIPMLQLWRGARSGNGWLTLCALSRTLALDEMEKARSKRLYRLLRNPSLDGTEMTPLLGRLALSFAPFADLASHELDRLLASSHPADPA